MNFPRRITRTTPCILIALLIAIGAAAPTCHADDQSDKEGELFLVAQKAFDDGFYDVAIRYIDQFLDQYPEAQKRVEAQLLSGQCYFFKGQYLKAFEVLENLLQFPEYKDATLFWLAETYLKGSNYKEAVENYRQIIDVYPSSTYVPQSYYSLGWAYFEQKNYDAAQEAFLYFVKQFPLHELAEDAFFKVGECAYNSGQYENAAAYFKNYVMKFPRSRRHDHAYFYIGESFYYLEQFSAAVEYYLKAGEITSDSDIMLLSKVSIGWSYFKLQDFDNAQRYFDEAYALAEEKNMPSDDIYLGRASLFFEKTEYAQALTMYDELITAFPQSPRLAEAHLGKANSLYSLERYSDAIAQYRATIDAFAADPQTSDIVEKACFGLAWTYLKSDNIAAAIENFQRVADQTHNNIVKVSALTQIGDAHQDLGELTKALAVYDNILEQFPNSMYTDYVQYRQAIALLKMDKIEAATIAFQSLQANFPDSKYLTDVKYYLGLAYFKKGDWVSTRNQINEFIKALPRTHTLQPEAHYILGLSTYNLNDFETAIKIFNWIIKNFPDRIALVRDAEINIAKCLYSMGDDKEALKRFKIIAYKYPQTPTALESLFWLGDYYINADNHDNAIMYYQQIVDEFPGNEQIDTAHFRLGQAYQKAQRFDEALNQYKQINDTADRELFAKAKIAIADIFAMDLEPGAAIDAYRAITQSCPEFTRDAYVKIALVYRKNRQYKKAVESYRRALDAAVGLSAFADAELQFYIADLLEESGEPQKAIDAYLKIPYLHAAEQQWALRAYLRVAKIFEDSEDWENAKLVYEKIIQYEADESKFARERIAWINENSERHMQP